MQVKGTAILQFIFISEPCMKSVDVNFLVVFTHNNAYNAILGKPSLDKICAIISTSHFIDEVSNKSWHWASLSMLTNGQTMLHG